MPRTTYRNNAADRQALYDITSTIRCKLFSDVVPELVCLLRNKELNETGGFSCGGCPMELRLMKDILGIDAG